MLLNSSYKKSHLCLNCNVSLPFTACLSSYNWRLLRTIRHTLWIRSRLETFTMRKQPGDQNKNENGTSATEWEMERIQRHCVVDDTIYYHVIWKPTWESEDRLQHMLPSIIAWNNCHGYPETRRKLVNQLDHTLENWSGEVIGRKNVDGLAHYKIQWDTTIEPEANLENATGLVKGYWNKTPEA
ncbi:uncharacterized protein CTRU02_215410 [Colletotrichum truncatum]|uniref:Uncharacterized protein n=4 Tax=Colletotrichum truncatum TaxID=5467 RepID=A0ACC3YNV2_COLTU|nr:uncharacterized protein CTRU02_15798 [Colletotrichum truncatum]XP_036584321.1 uncharacterized protein CTRU02_05396 [Colletotrichum truncatum]XP_036584575.1 uncharacterized protein CTRU02_05650 [Colletotrichum truncatum]KAF6780646.1 hypothetical protein CTRU02_15798 [Colletotrichum truncatum]KAF6793839.1 hypothetical protein CTRU02_05396 [Colletotrichum truncatum]KAF6794093.1 hypothetical protein CTRU02_05650 [Colletotrichum truncatum]